MKIKFKFLNKMNKLLHLLKKQMTKIQNNKKKNQLKYQIVKKEK